MTKFVCPYCMQDYKKKEAVYACTDCGEIVTEMGMFEKRVKCLQEGCRGMIALRKCKHDDCDTRIHRDLKIPTAVLQTPNLPFSIVGVKGSGKTNYITVMLEELKKNNGLRLALSHQDMQTKDHHERHRNMIYEERMPPPGTMPGERPMPQVWSIKNVPKQTRKGTPTYTFTIFDGAGEDHERIEPNSPLARYIDISKAILFVLDPLTLSSIRRNGIVDQKVFEDSGGGIIQGAVTASNIIDDIARYIRDMSPRLKSGSILKIPVAVVLAKFDTVWNHPAFGSSAQVRSKKLTISNGKISTSEIDMVHAEIEHWLHEIGEGDLITTLDANFKTYKLFGVSSYGSPPQGANRLNTPDPHRVLDPIFWMFKNEKFID